MTKMEDIIKFSKVHGFIYQGSELYDGLANTWDYGPLGAEVKKNIKEYWWKHYIQKNKNSFGIDSSILMNPKVWVASGHVGGFNDPLMDCKSCKTRHRADNLIEEFDPSINADLLETKELEKIIKDKNIPCPNCKSTDFTPIRQFNLMFKTTRGVTEGNTTDIYLRPETAQGQFVNFANIQRSMRAKLPFGVGQIGKAFRNEITPGNFTFRTIEFEQMEYQLFCKKGEDDSFYNNYKDVALSFFKNIGLDEDKLKFKDHEKLAHYAKAACDIEYKFPFGWGEINGTHNRTDFDLTKHQEHSGKSLEYLDPSDNSKYIPYVVESTIGVDRAVLAVLCNSYEVETIGDNDTREVLHLEPKIAPYKVSVLPLIKKIHSDKANEVFNLLSNNFSTSYDDTGKIGKRYRRQDVIGTPYCITIDDNSINDNIVTVRNRDTMEQVSIKIEELISYINSKII